MKNIKYILLICVVATLFSCENKPFLYSTEQNKLNFFFERQQDSSIRKTFVYDDESRVRDTVFVKVKTLGFVVNYDRQVTFEQIEISEKDKVNAVAGKHYVPFNSKETEGKYVIKAGTAYASIPIIILRDASLKKDEVVLRIKIADNSDFVPGVLNENKKNIYIADKLTQPSNWMPVYFGNYGPVKHEFMIKVTGLRWDNDTFSKLTDYEYVQFLLAKLKYELKLENEHRGTGNELREEPKEGQDKGDIIKF